MYVCTNTWLISFQNFFSILSQLWQRMGYKTFKCLCKQCNTVSWATCCLRATGSAGLPQSILQNGISHTQGTDYIFIQVLTWAYISSICITVTEHQNIMYLTDASYLTNSSTYRWCQLCYLTICIHGYGGPICTAISYSTWCTKTAP